MSRGLRLSGRISVSSKHPILGFIVDNPKISGEGLADEYVNFELGGNLMLR